MKRGWPVAVLAVLTMALALVPATTASASPTVIGPYDWPTYADGPQHTGTAPTQLTPTNVQTLVPRWFFPTKDAVTANPVLVNNTIYVGSWDGHFYAIDATTGKEKWQYTLKLQPAVVPAPNGMRLSNPSNIVNNIESDGGMVTSSAYFLPGSAATGGADLVIFGGGYTLYALRASDGSEFFPPRDYPGRPELPPAPSTDDTRIFSSPVVVGNQILFGVTSDGDRQSRGYFVSADLATGLPQWKFETDVDTHGTVLNDGCGGIWSSPTVDTADSLVSFDVSDCDFFGNHNAAGVVEPYNERVLALHIGDGSLAWAFTPPRLDPHSPQYNGDPNCDWDFGATPNLGTLGNGTRMLGVGGKDGTYYALDPATGHLRWDTNVVYGGLAGGFLGSPAFDPANGIVVGSTALGDFGRFEGVGSAICQPGNLADLPIQEPSQVGFDAATGAVKWRSFLSQTFGPTTIAGGMTFIGSAVAHQVQIRSEANGLLLSVVPLLNDSDSAIVVGRDAIYLGTGTSEVGQLSGVWSYGLLADNTSSLVQDILGLVTSIVTAVLYVIQGL